MVIKGLKHLAEISRMFDQNTRRERFRYALRHESSPDILYWGHEHTEEAAIEMANMYLNLLDECVAEMRRKRIPRGEHVHLISTPTALRA